MARRVDPGYRAPAVGVLLVAAAIAGAMSASALERTPKTAAGESGDAVDDRIIRKKLGVILENEEIIQRRLDDISKEAQIVKVRVSQPKSPPPP